MLFDQGDRPSEVFYLEQGVVKLVHSETDGTEQVLELPMDGSILGASAAIIDKRHPVRAITMRHSRLSRIDAQAFRRSLRDDPAWSRRLLELLSRENHELMERVGFTMLPPGERLVRFLWRLAPKGEPTAAGGIRVKLPLRSREVAELIGVAAPSLSNQLKKLASKGYIRREPRGALVLLQRPPGKLAR